jgi:2-C-methyl-D-erythritol 4-phosphate cytidylyltransferase
MAIPTSPKEQNLNAAAVVPAAGRGERLGPGAPKALRELGGVPILVHAVRALLGARSVRTVVVAAPADGVSGVRALLDEHGLPGQLGKDVRVVAGGETRQASVRLALAALPAETDVVLVHDAARPLVPVEVVEAVAGAVDRGAGAVVPGVPLADTVKQVEPAAEPGGPEPVVGTPERARLRAVQTPQGFRRGLLVEVHAKAHAAEGTSDEAPVTDDAGLVERFGGQVVVVPGHEEAFKVTRPLDLVLAEAVLARRRAVDGF